MSRKFIVGGNWKMNGVKKEIDEIVGFLKTGPLDPNVGKLKNDLNVFPIHIFLSLSKYSLLINFKIY